MPGANLLTATFIVFDLELNPLKKLRLWVKPDPVDGRTIFQVEPEALAVNKIDLIEHDKKSITYKEAKPILYQWLSETSAEYGYLIPFGNQVQGDINKITETIISKNSWSQFVDRRVIELSSLGQTLKVMGKIPFEASLSLGSIAKTLGIPFCEDSWHDDEYDVNLGASVLAEYMRLFEVVKTS